MEEISKKDSIVIRQLVSGTRSEINKGLEYLYKINYPIISRFIKHNSGSEAEAADIFQDSLITFYENIRNSKFELTCSIGTYLYSISRNLWLKRLSKLKRTSTKIEDIQDYLQLPEENNFFDDNSNLIEAISEIFKELSDKCRKILISFYYDNLSMKDIKKITQYKSEQAVKNKKFKCMKELSNIVSSSPTRQRILKDFLTA